MIDPYVPEPDFDPRDVDWYVPEFPDDDEGE